MYTVILVIHILLALGIVLFVLIQRSDNDGFGLSGGGNSLFSSRTTANFLTRTTAFLATGLFITSLAMAIMISNRGGDSILDRIDEDAAAVSEKVAAPEAPKAAEATKDVPAAAPAEADKAVEDGATEEAAPSVPLAD